LAEKRLGELQMRTGKPFKKLLSFNGDALDELEVYNPISNQMIPVVINNEVSIEYGTGIDCVSPAHDLESLNVAYHYGLDKSGYVTESGILDDQLGSVYEGKSIFEDETNQLVSQMIKEDG
jgi:valyl-tRNA synthetase